MGQPLGGQEALAGGRVGPGWLRACAATSLVLWASMPSGDDRNPGC